MENKAAVRAYQSRVGCEIFSAINTRGIPLDVNPLVLQRASVNIDCVSISTVELTRFTFATATAVRSLFGRPVPPLPLRL